MDHFWRLCFIGNSPKSNALESAEKNLQCFEVLKTYFLREAFVQMGLDCSRSLVGQESYDPPFHNSTFLPFETSGKRMFYSGRLVHNTFEDWIGSSFASVQPAGRSSIRFLSNFHSLPFLPWKVKMANFIINCHHIKISRRVIQLTRMFTCLTMTMAAKN